MIFELVVILASSVLIFYAGEHVATASSLIGEHLRLSKSVKGATIDAIASSLPELMIALFSVIAFGTFEVGVGAIAGSALFNLLIIPAVSIWAAGGSLALSRMVVIRDSWYHLFTKVVLMIMVFFTAYWNSWLALVLLGLYAVYVWILSQAKHTTRHDTSLPAWPWHKTLCRGIVSVILMGLGAYYLTEYSILLANDLGVPPLLIAFTVVAIATSVPDLVVSVTNAKKHSGDDAISNVLGSNTFDVFVALGLPLLVANMLTGPVKVALEYPELITLLFLASLGFSLIAQHKKLLRVHAWIFLFSYVAITVYVVFLAIGT